MEKHRVKRFARFRRASPTTTTSARMAVLKFDLEDRLVKFSGNIMLMASKLKKDQVGVYLSNQIVRSSGSAGLNFGEVQGAITRRDFIHKANIVLKELKETRVSLKLIKYVGQQKPNIIDGLLDECEQLIAIIASIIRNKKKMED